VLVSDRQSLFGLRGSQCAQVLRSAPPLRTLLRVPRQSVDFLGPDIAKNQELVFRREGPGPTASADREAIAAALEMLPKQPVRIAVMDVAKNRPEVRDYLLTLDAFTVKGHGVIYTVQQSATLEGARRGSTLFRAMLAVVIWHEMAHLDGAAERGARKAEEELWGRFVRDGVTDQVTALRVWQELRKRPDDLQLAAR
jgi:hypothetical protein